MSETPFKLRSGNTTPFKMMGSSPLRAESKLSKVGKERASGFDFDETVAASGQEEKWEDPGDFLKKEPVGPIANPPEDYYMNPADPPKAKPIVKSTPKPDPNVSVTNPNIVAEPVTTNVVMPNPNLEISKTEDTSTVRDVLMNPVHVITNPNKAIRTQSNVFSKIKKKIGKGYRKSKKAITNILDKPI